MAPAGRSDDDSSRNIVRHGRSGWDHFEACAEFDATPDPERSTCTPASVATDAQIKVIDAITASSWNFAAQLLTE